MNKDLNEQIKFNSIISELFFWTKLKMLRNDWDTYFGNSGPPTDSKIESKDRYGSTSDGRFYFSHCYFYEYPDSGIEISNTNNIILLCEYSSFISCQGKGGLIFRSNGQSVLDHLCFSFCWNSDMGQSFDIDAYGRYDGSEFNYKNYAIMCSVTNCGKDEDTGRIVFGLNFGQPMIDNANLSSNKCKSEAGFIVYHGNPESICKFIIVTNCNCSEMLIQYVCRSPYRIANSYVSVIQNKCGDYIVWCYHGYDIRLNNSIFLQNMADYGYYLPFDGSITVTNSYVEPKKIYGNIIFSNLRNDLFSIYQDTSDDKNCNNVYLIVVKVKQKCSCDINLHSLLLFISFVNILMLKV